MPTSSLKPNNVLVIDTATASLAVGINGQVLKWKSDQNHADKLLVMIDRVLKKAAVKPEMLSGVVFVAGPGSFTGLRIGATVANGIGFVRKIGIVGMSEFDLLAILVPKQDLMILDAGRGEVFVRGAGKPAELISISGLAKRVKRGDRVYIDSPELVALVHSQVKLAGTITIGPIQRVDKLTVMMTAKVPKRYSQVLPLYLREANITKSTKTKARPKNG